VLLGAAVLLLALIASCTTAVNGTPRRAAGLSCPGPGPAAISSCLRTSLTTFWTREMHRRFRAPVVLDFSPASVPRACRGAISIGTAFTCPNDLSIYLTPQYVAAMQHAQPAGDTSYRFAATLGHEMGHIVQFSIHEPLVTEHRATTDNARSQQIEQQADCLSGVWASHVGLNAQRFLVAAQADFTIIDSPFERRTHGDPTVRLAAIRRGLTGGMPKSCGLVGKS
jgi:predicted metalloprotease